MVFTNIYTLQKNCYHLYSLPIIIWSKQSYFLPGIKSRFNVNTVFGWLVTSAEKYTLKIIEGELYKIPSTTLHSTIKYFLSLWVSYPISLMRHG